MFQDGNAEAALSRRVAAAGHHAGAAKCHIERSLLGNM
jgi:hypothetical protein